ncbi:PrgI family protein [Patescibacteria group bacterium]|nr:PrgI family protein [Patescibacteria group bacterium]MBU1563948.1 PrgI family protein [Patescibacteria group bacterium]
MQFRVPQFIEIEDQIIGPLTIKQFLYLLAGVGILTILWFYLTLVAFLLIGLPISIFMLALAFYKVNGRPFISLIGSFVKYITKPKLYLWRKK